jgi:soluble P-type ATPase
MNLYEMFNESSSGWNVYTGIGHAKGSIVYYILPGGKIVSHEYKTTKNNHDASVDGLESKAIAVGRIDQAAKKISVRTPLAPGNSWAFIPQAKLDFIAKKLEKSYPGYEIWYFGNGATDIRRIDTGCEASSA